MRIIDVSLTLSDKLPVWPGDPRVSLERVRKIEDGANSNVSHLDMQVHTGTHIDAPVHFLQGGTGVDRISLPELIGPCFVVEIPPDSGNITAEILESTHIPSGITRLLMKTSNSGMWERGETEFNTGFVGLAEDGAKLLVSKGIHLVGIDYLSIAPYKQSRPTHEALLKAGMVILEGLDLHAVSTGYYSLICLPLKLAGSDGAPARVVLIDEV
jgi:arylformamidase